MHATGLWSGLNQCGAGWAACENGEVGFSVVASRANDRIQTDRALTALFFGWPQVVFPAGIW